MLHFACVLVATLSMKAADVRIIDALKSNGVEFVEGKGAITGANIRDCTSFTASDYSQLRGIGGLKQLSLGKGCNAEVLKALGPMPELETLSTNGMDAADDAMETLAVFPKLKTIAFFHPGKQFSGTGLASLSKLSTLERLTVAGSAEVGDAALAAIAKLGQLKELRIWHTGATTAGLQHLGSLKKLTSFTLGQRLSSSPPVTLSDDGIEIISGLTSLESVTLQEARLTPTALAKLKKLPNLKRLTLDGIDVPESAIADLKKQLPAVDVRWTAPNEQARKRIDALFGKDAK
jgi:hypothetical protein